MDVSHKCPAIVLESPQRVSSQGSEFLHDFSRFASREGEAPAEPLLGNAMIDGSGGASPSHANVSPLASHSQRVGLHLRRR